MKVLKMTEGGFKNIDLISFPLYLFINIQCVCYSWRWDGLKKYKWMILVCIIFLFFVDIALKICKFFFVLQRDLQQKQSEQVIRQIMYDIISGIKTPDRPSSPIDAYITDEEIFSRNNPKVWVTIMYNILYIIYIIYILYIFYICITNLSCW